MLFFLVFFWVLGVVGASSTQAPENHMRQSPQQHSSDGDDGLAMMMQPLFGSLEWSGGADGAIQGIVL